MVAYGRGNTAWRTIEEARDVLEVEQLVRSFVAMGRTQIRVSWTTAYGVPPSNTAVEGCGEEDDVPSGEEVHRTAMGIGKAGTPEMETRRAATVVEIEKTKLAQAEEKNWTPELLERYRCALPPCLLFGKGAWLIRSNKALNYLISNISTTASICRKNGPSFRTSMETMLGRMAINMCSPMLPILCALLHGRLINVDHLVLLPLS